MGDNKQSSMIIIVLIQEHKCKYNIGISRKMNTQNVVFSL